MPPPVRFFAKVYALSSSRRDAMSRNCLSPLTVPWAIGHRLWCPIVGPSPYYAC